LMDTDKNGYADIFEVRAYLEKIHGRDYQKELLDKWESSASGKSCSTSFAKQLYLSNAIKLDKLCCMGVSHRCSLYNEH